MADYFYTEDWIRNFGGASCPVICTYGCLRKRIRNGACLSVTAWLGPPCISSQARLKPCRITTIATAPAKQKPTTSLRQLSRPKWLLQWWGHLWTRSFVSRPAAVGVSPKQNPGMNWNLASLEPFLRIYMTDHNSSKSNPLCFPPKILMLHLSACPRKLA